MTKIFLPMILILFLSQFSLAADDCGHCAELNKIYDQYKSEATKEKPNFNSLQLKASEIILKMGKNKNHLTPQQTKSVVQIYAISISVDPARFILDNTIVVLKANRTEIEAEAKKLPGGSSAELLEAIYIAIVSTERPNDG